MAINDVSLTAGMRANLLSLQGTVDLLNRTQSRLSSGKKVNSAIDNPVSFFASQALTARASTIDSLKDGMGQAVQTIQAADKGIKAITGMIEQAKGIAQAALSADTGNAFSSVDVTLANVAIGDKLTIGGVDLTAGPVAGADVYTKFSLTLGNVAAGTSVEVGGVTFTGRNPVAGPDDFSAAKFTIDFTGMANDDEIIVGGVTYTAKAVPTLGNEFITGDAASLMGAINTFQAGAYIATTDGTNVFVEHGTTLLNAASVSSADVTVTDDHTNPNLPLAANEFDVSSALASADATALQGAIQAYFGTGYTVGIEGAGNNVVTIQANDMGLSANTAANASAGTIAITDDGAPGPGVLDPDTEFLVGGNDAITAMNIADLFNTSADVAITDLRDAGYTVTANDGVVTVAREGVNVVKDAAAAAANQVAGTAVRMVAADVEAATELADLQSQYTEMMRQIDELAADSGYKGKNLIDGNDLIVKFEGTDLTVKGFTATSGGDLNIAQAAGKTWIDAGGDIDADIAGLDDALSTLRQKSSALSGNLSIITVRNEFSTNMINTLTEGSDKLTLADANEEGANMLMLQTRQTLSTTALSMSAQAAQSVLRLFQ